MTEHESIRDLLALAAAGVLETADQLRVDRHTRECEACRKELATWSVYAQQLHGLPQPAVPVQLVERTRARVLRQHAAMAERRGNELTLLFLVLFSWIVGLTSWYLLRMVTGGALRIFGSNILSPAMWSLSSTVLLWASAAVAAVALGKSRREMRRSYEPLW